MLNESYFDGFHISSVRSFGTRVHATNTANGGTVIIYTVGVAEEMLLSEWWQNTIGAVNGTGFLSIYDDTPALLFYINQQQLLAGASLNTAKNVMPPYLLPTGYSIRLTSSIGGLNSIAGILGYTYDTA